MSDKIKYKFYNLIKHSFFYSLSFNVFKDKNTSVSIKSKDGKHIILDKIKDYINNNSVNNIKNDIYNFLKTNVVYDENIKHKIYLIKSNTYDINILFNKIKKQNVILGNHYDFIIKNLKSKMLMGGKKKSKRTRRRRRLSKKTKKKLTKKLKKTSKKSKSNKYKSNEYNEIDSMILIIFILINITS